MKEENILNELKKILQFESKEQEQEHKSRMISFIFLSEVEKRCDEMKMSRADLAEGLGTSKSYITQLFRGDKQINTKLIGKIEMLLGIKFEVKAVQVYPICYKSNKLCKYNCGLCRDSC